MATAKCLRRQADRCAALAAETNDDESRQRYSRLEDMYRQLIEAEEPPAEQPAGFQSETERDARPLA